MIDQLVPRNTGGDLVREKTAHMCIIALRPGTGCAALRAGLVDRSGGFRAVFKMVVSAFIGRDGHLLSCLPLAGGHGPRGPPASLGFLKNPRKR